MFALWGLGACAQHWGLLELCEGSPQPGCGTSGKGKSCKEWGEQCEECPWSEGESVRNVPGSGCAGFPGSQHTAHPQCSLWQGACPKGTQEPMESPHRSNSEGLRWSDHSPQCPSFGPLRGQEEVEELGKEEWSWARKKQGMRGRCLGFIFVFRRPNVF